MTYCDWYIIKIVKLYENDVTSIAIGYVNVKQLSFYHYSKSLLIKC